MKLAIALGFLIFAIGCGSTPVAKPSTPPRAGLEAGDSLGQKLDSADQALVRSVSNRGLTVHPDD